MDATIIWDLEDEMDGNVQHLREHDVTIEEAEEVLLNPESSRAPSRTSGLPTAFGWTATGRHLAVVYLRARRGRPIDVAASHCL